MRSLNEKCAVFGVYGKGMDVSRLTYFGLFALQHRGQESSGIAVGNGEEVRVHRGMGLVASVFSEEAMRGLTGFCAIGHNRYSTSKDSSLDHAQPIVVANGALAFAHNGNLPSTAALRLFLTDKRIAVEGFSDSHLMALAVGWYFEQGSTLADAVMQAYPLFTGAFSLVAMTKDSMVAVKDHCGIRPLALARLNGGFIVSSETCAFGPVGATFEREINAGEIAVIDANGLRVVQVATPNPKFDIFEFIYFSRHNSMLLGKSVYEVRKNFGKNLAKEYPVEADVVIAVPQTSTPVAIGYARQSGSIPYEMGLSKNRYIQRTFIEPDQKLRDLGVKMKLTPLPEVLKGKRVIVIDDSIVRGTTSRQVIQLLFEAGAAEVHFLVSSPPIRFPDFYGIDISRQKELLAFGRSVEEMRNFLGATSSHFLSLQGMIAATGLPPDIFNTSCFTGEYPIDLHERAKDFVLQNEK